MATVTISQFRKDLFTLVDSAADGETVEFIHKGIRFRLILPDSPAPSKLDRITPLAKDIMVGSPAEFAAAHSQMSQEIIEDWEKSWDK